MTKRYLLNTQPALGLQAAVYAVGAVSPMEALDEIEQDLSSKNVTGAVLFDLLLTNGNKANRYFVGTFDGRKFIKSEMKSAEASYSEYSPMSAQMFKGHVSDVDSSLLTNAMQFALRAGIPL